MEAISYPVVNKEGKEVDTFALDPEVFGLPFAASLVHDTIRWQLSARRAGTHSVLTKGKMKGGGRKPWRQKGTGRARAGSNTSPLWVGGGVAHGPKPRSYESRLSKRTRRSALCSVLSEKVREKRLIVVKDLDSLFEKASLGKTKEMGKVIRALGIGEEKVLFVIASNNGTKLRSKKGSGLKGDKIIDTKILDSKIQRASRNLSNVHLLSPMGINCYDLLRSKFFLVPVSTLLQMQEMLKQEKRGLT